MWRITNTKNTVQNSTVQYITVLGTVTGAVRLFKSCEIHIFILREAKSSYRTDSQRQKPKIQHLSPVFNC